MEDGAITTRGKCLSSQKIQSFVTIVYVCVCACVCMCMCVYVHVCVCVCVCVQLLYDTQKQIVLQFHVIFTTKAQKFLKYEYHLNKVWLKLALQNKKWESYIITIK